VKYGIEVHLTVDSHAPSGVILDHVDKVTEHLIELEDCTEGLLDSSIGADAFSGDVEVELTVQASSTGDAVALAMSCLRSAIHAAGGGTSGWDETPDDQGVVVYTLEPDGEGVVSRPLVDA
jgi:hypothetical protein